MNIIVDVSIKEHVSGNKYCLVEAEANGEGIYKASFSFSLEYLFDFVLPEHRIWFIKETISQQMKSENKELGVTNPEFIIKNVDEVLKKCEELRKKVVASEI